MIPGALTNDEVKILDSNGDPITTDAGGNLKTARYDVAGNIAPAMDTVGREGFFIRTDGTNLAPAMDAAARLGYIRHTDGVNLTPALDAVGRAGYFIRTDGTNTAPTMDAVGRAGYQRPTDGTNEPLLQLNTAFSDNLDGQRGFVNASAMYGRVSDTLLVPIKVEGSTQDIQCISQEHAEIHSGDHYFVGGYQDLSINNVLDFTWQMPNTTKWSHWVWKISTESETLWSVYETVVATNPLANAVTPYNSNRNSANTSATTMKFEVQSNLAAANTDTDVTGAILLDSGISGAGRDAGNEVRSDEIMMKQNALYCLRSEATAAGYINFHMKWYEHTDKN